MSRQQTILIVEDNEYNLDIAKDILEMAGYQILEAQEVDTGIKLAKTHHPDLILMDMYLPIINGYQAVQILKADPQTKDIPIVAFTALAMSEDRKRAEAVGCAGVISKPILVDNFAETVTSYLNHPTPLPSILNSIPLAFSGEQALFSTLSHDFQAPLRKIQQCCGFIQGSVPENLSEENRQFVEMIARSTEQMFELLTLNLERFREVTKC
jgi:two-component system cell cycle response regulator DivK